MVKANDDDVDNSDVPAVLNDISEKHCCWTALKWLPLVICETVEAELTFWYTLLCEKIWVGCSGMTDTKSSHNGAIMTA